MATDTTFGRCQHWVRTKAGVIELQCNLPADHIEYGIEQHRYELELVDEEQPFKVTIRFRNWIKK